MSVSVNCLIAGQASKDVFSVPIGENTSVNKVDVSFDTTVSMFKEVLFNTNPNVRSATQYSDNMVLYKVDLGLEDLKSKIYTKDEIEGGISEMMEPMYDIEDYFNNKDKVPVRRHLHIFIVPITARNLPEKLEYRDPHPLLKTSGSSWDFQASDALKKILKDEIHDHFGYWKKGQLDKTTIPQYFILAGAGEGKSRTAQELPKLLIECTNDDVELQNRLKSALVFNLSFENGTKLFRKEEARSSYAIGNRMLFQLLRQPNEYWNVFKDRYDITPEDVLYRVAKHRNQEFKDLNVIIILDGIQVAMSNSNDSFFYNCISSLGILSLSGPFIVTCCTATISMPIHNFLASPQQKRVLLPITSLQPPKIGGIPIFNDSQIMNMFVDDMGGHGRALETLGDLLNVRDLNEVNFIDLINDVRSVLTDNYSEWLSKTDYLRPILSIILSHTPVSKDDIILGLNGKKVKVDDLIQYGLVRFESSDPREIIGYLSCPYIWLWIMAHATRKNDPLLQNWDFTYYKEVLNESGKSSIPPGSQYWQHFEYFVAQFRSLKSDIYEDNKQVGLSVIHNGATHNFEGASIYNQKLTLSTSVHKASTKSEDYRNCDNAKILCQEKTVDIKEAKHIIINAPSAKAGDSFCPIKMVGTDQLQTETHQCKLVKDSISQQDFDDEYKKATSQGDIFILYTSASSKGLKLQNPMSAIVSKDNWKTYFGPFSGRCYNYAMGPPNINEATFTQLTGFEQIADQRAITIMEERKKRKFSDIEDCNERTKIPRQYLKPFFQ